jgi:hypothetical protein
VYPSRSIHNFIVVVLVFPFVVAVVCDGVGIVVIIVAAAGVGVPVVAVLRDGVGVRVVIIVARVGVPVCCCYWWW